MTKTIRLEKHLQVSISMPIISQYLDWVFVNPKDYLSVIGIDSSLKKVQEN